MERVTAVERRALAALTSAWVVGLLVSWSGVDGWLAASVEARLDPPLPSVEELTARRPPGDPRPGWYAAAVALRDLRARSSAAPVRIDPNAADRAAWDRLPGIGPRTARTILAHRAEHGPFRGPEDLLAVHGIGPVTLERLEPWIAWPALPPRSSGGVSTPTALPDLNAVGAADLATLEGIGPTLAKRIEHERRRHGGFRTWSDVLAIEGVGRARLGALQNATRLGDRKAPLGNASTVNEGNP